MKAAQAKAALERLAVKGGANLRGKHHAGGTHFNSNKFRYFGALSADGQIASQSFLKEAISEVFSMSINEIETAFREDDLPAWATQNANDLLRYLFVSPRPCAALDELLSSPVAAGFDKAKRRLAAIAA